MNKNIGVWISIGNGVCTLIDREVQQLFEKTKWFLLSKGKARIPYAGKRLRYGKNNYRTVSLHKLLVPCSPRYVIDHINGDTLDNRVDNLRICSVAENNRNRKCQKQYKGVSLMKNGRWRSYIHHDRKFFSLGIYNTAWKAAVAYNSKASELWGDYARLNIYNENWGDRDDYNSIASVQRATARIAAGERARKRAN